MIPFIKAQSLGNDFVIFHQKEIDKFPHLVTPEFLQRLAHRRFGIGCDQVIIYDDSRMCDITFPFVSVMFFNADGSKAQSCGNGSRALGRLMMDQYKVEFIRLRSIGGDVLIHQGDGDSSQIVMPLPKIMSIEIIVPKPLNSLVESYFCIDAGNPHVVFIIKPKMINSMNDLHALATEYGYQIEHMPQFLNKTNVSFASLNQHNDIELVVHERGVGMTLACGTAANATALAFCSYYMNLNSESLRIQQKGGFVDISFSQHSIVQSGTSRCVFTGVYDSTL